MKKSLVVAVLFAGSLTLNAQVTKPATDEHGHVHGAVDTAKSVLDIAEVKEMEYDFGTIPQGKPVYHSFEVKNIGAVPLVLTNVQTTCGCTTPEWSKEPIPTGQSTKVKVGYNAATEGYFEKFITLQYNGLGSKQIKIKGTVWKAPAGSAPANASIQFLKNQLNN